MQGWLNSAGYEKWEGDYPAIALTIRSRAILHRDCFVARPNMLYHQTLFEYQ
jgi:hypothetical protein